MLLYLEPLDTLFFRDSRPFDAGMDTFSESTLPSPLAIYGAIGSYILGLSGTSLEDFIQQGDKVLGTYSDELNGGKLQIKGIFMTQGEQLFLPVPANIFGYPEKSESPTMHSAKPDSEGKGDYLSNLPEGLKPLLIPQSQDQEFKQLSGFIDMDTVTLYLDGKLDGINRRLWRRDDFLGSEPRYGTSIDGSLLTVREGFLYSSIHLRFKQELVANGVNSTGLAVLIDDIPQLKDGICSLGGERKKAIMRNGDSSAAEMRSGTALNEIVPKQRFLLYLVTPAILSSGWRLNLPEQFNNANLVGAAVNKPEYFSGWKRSASASGEPRKMRRMVPAGSVYFFEAPSWNDGDFRRTYDWLIENSISDEYKAAGFGVAAMGVW